MTAATTAGQARFARYAYPPNQLGYCGPDGAEALLAVGAGLAADGAAEEVDRRARAFDGAWVYLQLIAAAAGIDNPLDERVVEAYWVGNDLLDDVDPHVFAATVRAAFAAEAGADWRTLALRDPAAVPHHSFQVFAVYPWVGLLGRGDTARHVLDRCRIRTGVVRAVLDDHVDVTARPLIFDGARLGFGAPQLESAQWSDGGRALAGPGGLVPGDQVALHWNWVCERLSPAQAATCEAFTWRQVELTNAARAQ